MTHMINESTNKVGMLAPKTVSKVDEVEVVEDWRACQRWTFDASAGLGLGFVVGR